MKSVLKSLLRPKRIALRGGDGRRYLIMCKPNDELRKDARFMDVNRMMNSLMRQNADARRRQLSVRTFSVIPLQFALAGHPHTWTENWQVYVIINHLCSDAVIPEKHRTEWEEYDEKEKRKKMTRKKRTKNRMNKDKRNKNVRMEKKRRREGVRDVEEDVEKEKRKKKTK
ncbi:unnamed protein product [Heligmosomoides polygyrus]|uniref:PI3K/PI4K domain-containing protein n=1 Tax=Heligmosomoides polygyrus TaxID=6339 RepID=A0A3P8E499_HELPZ|nr:unnamed protein product [Heligmosomoides polygyrus]